MSADLSLAVGQAPLKLVCVDHGIEISGCKQVNSCKLPLHADLDHSAKPACELTVVNCTLHPKQETKE